MLLQLLSQQRISWCNLDRPLTTNKPGQDCFNGALDDVHLFNDDLTQGQIIKLMGLEERYFPIESPAELYDKEPQNFRSINFRDLEVLAETRLKERLWPGQ